MDNFLWIAMEISPIFPPLHILIKYYPDDVVALSSSVSASPSMHLPHVPTHYLDNNNLIKLWINKCINESIVGVTMMTSSL